MSPWLILLQLLLQLFKWIVPHDDEAARYAQNTLAEIDKANRAKRDVRHDPDSVRNDPDNRDQ